MAKDYSDKMDYNMSRSLLVMLLSDIKVYIILDMYWIPSMTFPWCGHLPKADRTPSCQYVDLHKRLPDLCTQEYFTVEREWTYV